MSGPIVRTGATPEFWKNWDAVFGGKKARPAPKKAAAPAKAAKATKPAKSAGKKSAKKK
jgi:hypothetical protein